MLHVKDEVSEAFRALAREWRNDLSKYIGTAITPFQLDGLYAVISYTLNRHMAAFPGIFEGVRVSFSVEGNRFNLMLDPPAFAYAVVTAMREVEEEERREAADAEGRLARLRRSLYILRHGADRRKRRALWAQVEADLHALLTYYTPATKEFHHEHRD